MNGSISPAIFVALSLALAVVGFMPWMMAGLQAYLLIARANRRVGFVCSSCRECFETTEPRPVLQMRNSGWLVLPGNVHYCPECTAAIAADMDRQRAASRETRDARSAFRELMKKHDHAPIKPYAPPAGEGGEA